MMDTVRIDKFLWSVRIYKTRTIAAEECEKHRVLVNDAEVKPSRHVKVGDKLKVKKLPVVYTYDVIQLIDKRQSASLVKNFITDTTPQEELAKAEMNRMTAFIQRDSGTGRPTKKERRELEKISSL
jgi:ribosome-associated heat shock protein Hsp15